MDLQSILELTKAGFTKTEIMALVQTESAQQNSNMPVQTVQTPVQTVQTPVQTVQTPVQTVQTPVQTVQTPVQTVQTNPSTTQNVQNQTTKTEAQTQSNTDEVFQTFLQKIAGVSSSIDVPPTYSVQDKLSEHFTYLLVGNQKGE